ncbi:nuclear transport factor 2 family protein [Tunicatimonas pelagia]|uniref:nuclear transport factor 2 family protein n=1 Tax=Tunicatimonas pelagia TaxID=931531 RepID=UPI002666B6EA|nr:nuclear transport factor 2 family protein [Tunicatimonas pelagia]WKN43913.1 nuclear transport factor 2 family protein [Tunicatimonas pelagia]
MKQIAVAVAIALSLIACKNETKTNDKKNDLAVETIVEKTSKEQKEIQQLITSFFNNVDERNWNEVAAKMSDSVYTDYTALGGDAGFKTPNEILTGWKAILPGFERTIHQTHNEAIWVAGNRASATLDAIATHYLKGDFWTVFVGYDTEYIKENGSWKLARIDLSLYNQAGNNELSSKAIENVKNGNIPPLVKANNTESIETFFSSLENKNLKGVLSTLEDNIIQEMPFAPNNFPKSLNGIEAMRTQYTGVMDYTQSYEREYFGTPNPNVILVKYNGTITTGEGKPYNNYYVGIYELSNNNKIQKFVEQFNPNILLNGWPGLQPETYSVHKAGAKTNSGVKLEKVNFNSNGVSLAGHLFLPPNFDSTKKYPTAIVTGSWTSVKEQMPDEYASLMAKNGFITLTFDFTGFGESEGQPRQVEDYNLKIADIKAAVDYLSHHQNVDTEQISGLGVCASSGYMAHATAQDKRIKKLILIAPWLHNPAIAKSIYDMRPNGTDGLLNAAKKAKEKYAETGEMDYVLAASELDPLSAMYVPENAFDYYLDPAKAAGAKYDNRFAVSSWEPWLTFNGISAGKEISQPVFIVHSESGAVPQGTKDFYTYLKGQKDIVWLNEYNQQQLYFEADAVNAAMSQVVYYLK